MYRKFYFLVMVLLGLVVALLGSEDTMLFLALVTLGLAFFLAIPLVTGFFYLLGLMPLAILRREKWKPGVTLSALLIAAIAFGPGLLGRLSMTRAEARLKAQELGGNLAASERPDTVEIIDRTKDGAACGALCLAVLGGGGAGWVRMTDGSGRSLTYRLENGLPVVTASEAAPGLQLVRETMPTAGYASGLFAKITNVTRLEATSAEGASRRIVLRRFAMSGRIPDTPTVVFPHFEGTHGSSGYGLGRRTRASAPHSLRSALAELGYGLAEGAGVPSAPPDVEAASAELRRSIVASIVAQADDGPLSEEKTAVVRDWVNGLRDDTGLSPEDAETLLSALRSLPAGTFKQMPLDRIYRASATARATLMPWLLDMLEWKVTVDPTARALLERAMSITPLEPALITRHQAHLAAFLGAVPDAPERNPMLAPIAARFGIDPLPLLDRALAGPMAHAQFREITLAVCAMPEFPSGHLGPPYANLVQKNAPKDRRVTLGTPFWFGVGLLLRDGQTETARVLYDGNSLNHNAHLERRVFGVVTDPTATGYKNCTR